MVIDIKSQVSLDKVGEMLNDLLAIRNVELKQAGKSDKQIADTAISEGLIYDNNHRIMRNYQQTDTVVRERKALIA